MSPVDYILGDYGSYIIGAYGVAFLVFFMLALSTFWVTKTYRKRVQSLEEAQK